MTAFLPSIRSCKRGAYYFSMANLLKNKNFPWVLRAAKAKPDAVFAIAGGGSLAAEAERLGLADLPNVLYLGYVSDGAAKALMATAEPFFSRPSMRASASRRWRPPPAVRRRSLSAIRPCMREVYGPCAAYIEPPPPDAVNPGDVDATPTAFALRLGRRKTA